MSGKIEKLEMENNRLQQNVEVAHITIAKNLEKIQKLEGAQNNYVDNENSSEEELEKTLSEQDTTIKEDLSLKEEYMDNTKILSLKEEYLEMDLSLKEEYMENMKEEKDEIETGASPRMLELSPKTSSSNLKIQSWSWYI